MNDSATGLAALVALRGGITALRCGVRGIGALAGSGGRRGFCAGLEVTPPGRGGGKLSKRRNRLLRYTVRYPPLSA